MTYPDFVISTSGLTATRAQMIARADDLDRYRNASRRRFARMVAPMPPLRSDIPPPTESGAPLHVGVM